MCDALDRLCQMTRNPSVLNSLHACREGHPLGRDNPWKWRNAYFMCVGDGTNFLSDLEWLRRQAEKEGGVSLNYKP